MKSLSGKFVLITVLLQLFLSVLEVNAGRGGTAGEAGGGEVGQLVENEDDLQFGDLLVIADKFNHYAVYVGCEHFEGKEPDQNIFEMEKDPPGCRFHTEKGPFRRHNYLDPGIAPQGESLNPQSKQQMKRTIERLRKDPVCQTYNVATRNCEQIATKVRYNESHCKQLGTKSSYIAKLFPAGSVHRREAPAAA